MRSASSRASPRRAPGVKPSRRARNGPDRGELLLRDRRDVPVAEPQVRARRRARCRACRRAGGAGGAGRGSRTTSVPAARSPSRWLRRRDEDRDDRGDVEQRRALEQAHAGCARRSRAARPARPAPSRRAARSRACRGCARRRGPRTRRGRRPRSAAARRPRRSRSRARRRRPPARPRRRARADEHEDQRPVDSSAMNREASPASTQLELDALRRGDARALLILHVR